MIMAMGLLRFIAGGCGRRRAPWCGPTFVSRHNRSPSLRTQGKVLQTTHHPFRCAAPGENARHHSNDERNDAVDPHHAVVDRSWGMERREVSCFGAGVDVSGRGICGHSGDLVLIAPHGNWHAIGSMSRDEGWCGPRTWSYNVFSRLQAVCMFVQWQVCEKASTVIEQIEWG